MARKKKLTKTPTYSSVTASSHKGYGGGGSGGGGKGYTPPDIGSTVSGAGSSASGAGSAVGGSATGSASAGVASVTQGTAHKTGVKPAPPYQPPPPLISAISTVLPNLNPAEMLFAPYAVQAGARYNVSPALLMGVIKQESGFDPDYEGPRTRDGRAKGSTGFLPSTAEKYGVKFGANREAISSQVMGAAKYLAELDVNNDTEGALNRNGVDGGKAYSQPVEKAARAYGPLDRLAAKAATRYANSPAHDTAPVKQRAAAALASVGRQAEGQGQRVGQKQTLRQEALASYRENSGPEALAGFGLGAAGRAAGQKRPAQPTLADTGKKVAQATSAAPIQARAKKVKQELVKAVNGAKPEFASLDPEQREVLMTVLSEGQKAGASKEVMLSAVETAIVESGIRNLDFGDADSQGWRQERAMYYDNPTNVKASAQRYFQEAAAAAQPGMTPGEIAQAAQQSAFPDRYDQVAGEAMPLLRDFLGAADVDPALKKKAVTYLGKEQTKAILDGQAAAPANQAMIGKLRGPAPAIEDFKQILNMAQKIDAANKPYVWGGGHVAGKIPGIGKASGYDCSGFTSKVLQSIGLMKDGAQVSGNFGSVEGLAPGPGAVSIFYNEGHVFMRIGQQYYGTSSSGSAADPGGSTGSGGLITQEAGASEANSGNYSVVHVASLDGLKGAKVATKGIEPGPGGTYNVTQSAPVGAPSATGIPPASPASLSPAERKKVNRQAGVSPSFSSPVESPLAPATADPRSILSGQTEDPLIAAFANFRPKN